MAHREVRHQSLVQAIKQDKHPHKTHNNLAFFMAEKEAMKRALVRKKYRKTTH